jgi:hypothetical protein
VLHDAVLNHLNHDPDELQSFLQRYRTQQLTRSGAENVGSNPWL